MVYYICRCLNELSEYTLATLSNPSCYSPKCRMFTIVEGNIAPTVTDDSLVVNGLYWVEEAELHTFRVHFGELQ